MKNYDVIVIGAGSGGLTVSIGLAGAGKKVALIEKGLIGGDCTNVGCVPSKAFLDIARNMSEYLSATNEFNWTSDAGETLQFAHQKGEWECEKGLSPLQVALKETRARRKIIQDEEKPEVLEEKYPFDIYQGVGSFIDEHTIEVGGETISGKRIVVSTGGHAAEFGIEGVPKENLLTNEHVFEQTEDIHNLVIIGGGYIGCEMAEAFAHLGVNVTLIHRSERILSREEPETSEVITKHFEALGIKVMTNTSVIDGNDTHITIATGGDQKQEAQIPYDKILTTVGRRPNIDALNLDAAGIKYDRRGIFVNKCNRTNKKCVFAIGDCVSGNPQFTHWANNEGRAVVRNILFPYVKATNRNAHLPANLYTSPEVARVGLTERDAGGKYGSDGVVVQMIPFEHNDRSKVTNDEQGFIKIIYRRISGRILGASIVGKGAGEILSTITSYMENNVKAGKISRQVFAYPTKGEIIKRTADGFVFTSLKNIKKDAKWWFLENLFQIIGIILWATILIVFFSYKNANGLSFADMSKELYFFFKESGAWGPIVYMIIYAIRPVTFFPATFLTFISGALFGPFWGFVYTMIGENASASVAYGLGRGLGNRLIRGNTGILGDLQAKLEKRSFIPILFTRLAFFPFDVVNYAAGVLKARWSGFALGTAVGIIPGALVFILVGASISEITPDTDLVDLVKSVDTSYLWIALALFVASVVLAKFLNKGKK